MPTAADKEKQRLGVKARQDAIASLIESHREEFDRLLAKNRTDLGLPVKPQGPTVAELEERIKRQEQRLERWRRQLAQAT